VQDKHLSFLHTSIIDQEVGLDKEWPSIFMHLCVAKNESNNIGEVISIITIFLVVRGIE
jgi:hypothetical protein